MLCICEGPWQRQGLAAVRAMVNNPNIILADEPTGNLDKLNSRNLLALMQEIKLKYSKSFLIATHDELVLDIADRVLYLDDGKIHEE